MNCSVFFGSEEKKRKRGGIIHSCVGQSLIKLSFDREGINSWKKKTFPSSRNPDPFSNISLEDYIRTYKHLDNTIRPDKILHRDETEHFRGILFYL